MEPRRRSRITLAAALGLVLVATSNPAGTLASEGEPLHCDRGWYAVTRSEEVVPEGVVADGADVWIAGGSLLGGGRRQAAVLHLDGERSELEQPPPPDTRDSGFMGVTATADGERLWAVGFGRETDSVVAYAARRSLGGWDVSETIRPEGANAALTDVAASREYGTWAVGFLQGPPGDQRPWVLQRRGGDWIASEPPLAEAERGTLAGVSASDAGGVLSLIHI